MRVHIEVVQWRGSIPESRHCVQVAVCGPDGAVTLASERPEQLTTFRSSAKPFQLLPLVERGHAERWGWSDEQLAVMASSHTGSAQHLALVQGILERLELSPEILACGFHEPLDPESRGELRRYPESRSKLYNNCSGKHAGMLCLARSEGWPVQGYERPEHPVQQLMLRTVAEACGVRAESVPVAVDGCGVCVFGVPLAGMARAYARLAAARPGADRREQALARIRDCMRSHPLAAGGAQRFSTVLMQACAGRLVAKGGAEGLECIGLSERRLGVAVKCEDGHERASAPAALAVLEQLDILSDTEQASLDHLLRPKIVNHAGLEVGRLEARLSVAATP